MKVYGQLIGAGREVLVTLPVTGLFEGRMVLVDGIEYYYYGGDWIGPTSEIPPISGATDGQFLSNDGTNATWTASPSGVPAISGATDGLYLTNDGADPIWASVARSGIAVGTADHVVINSGTGALSSEATLASSRGGLGIDASAASGYVKYATGTATIGVIPETDLPSAIDAAKIGAGAVSSTEFGYLDGVTSGIQAQIDAKAPTGSYALTTNPLSQFAATTSAELLGIISDETGTGSLVFATSPTLVTPVLGAASATSINGTTIPASKTLVVTTDKLSVMAATTSAELAGVISDETGTGLLVFGTNPVITTPTLAGGTASNSSRWTVPSGTLAALTGLTRVEGVIVYATDTDKFYSDDGTYLNEVGSGSSAGGINYITSASTATGWSRTGTTGAAGNDPATTTTAGDLPLGGTVSTAIKIVSAMNAGAETVGDIYFPFTTPAAGAVRTPVTFFMRPGSNFIASEWTVSVYQGATRQSLITDSSAISYLPNASGQYVSSFDALASTAYTLRFARTVNAGLNVGQLNLANVFVGLHPINQGTAIGEPVPVVFTGSWTTNTTYTAFETKLGSWAKYEVKIALTGAPTSAGLSLTMPTGRTINAATMVNTANSSGNLIPNSTVGILDAGTAAYVGALSYQTSTALVVHYIDDAAAAVSPNQITQAAPITFATGDTITISFMVPIFEWAGQGTLNTVNPNVQSPIRAGTVQAFAGSTTPSGWLDCDGSSYTQVLYPQLYAQIGSTWATCTNTLTGSANSAPAAGSFRVPDLRGSFLRGAGTFSDGIGTNTTLAGYQGDQTQGHEHRIYGSTGAGAATTLPQINVNTAQNLNYDTNTVASSLISDGTNGTPRKGTETRPRNVGIKYIIKAWDESYNIAGFAMAGTDGSTGLVAAGRVPGIITGTAIAAGYVGEVIEPTSAITTTTATTTEADVNNASLPLTAGNWHLFYSVTAYYETGATATNVGRTMVCITDSANTHIGKSERNIVIKTPAAAATEADGCLAASCVVKITSNTTYKLRLKRTDVSGTGSGGILVAAGSYDATFYAVRI